MTGDTINLITLDGPQIRVPVTDVISPGHETRVNGEGMPLVDDPKNKGDLVIRYNVSFPAILNPQQKTLIRQEHSLDKH